MIRLFAVIILVVVLQGCKKEVTELPPASQNGQNIFGCKVNGKFWVPARFGIVPTASILEATYFPNRGILINARNFSSSPTESEFEIYLQHVVTPGVYLLNANTGIYPNQSANYGYYVERKFTPTNEWITSTQYMGSVNITNTDTVNRIVSGTFEFHAGSLYNAGESVSVTEGRFDIKIQ